MIRFGKKFGHARNHISAPIEQCHYAADETSRIKFLCMEHSHDIEQLAVHLWCACERMFDSIEVKAKMISHIIDLEVGKT